MIQLPISMLLSLLILWPIGTFVSFILGTRFNFANLSFVKFGLDPGFSPCISSDSFNYSAFAWYLIYFITTIAILSVIHRKVFFNFKKTITWLSLTLSIFMVINIVSSTKYIKQSHVDAPNSESCHKSDQIFEELNQKILKQNIK